LGLLLLNDRHLHPLVYFIADKPGKTNRNPKIPLVGTASYKKLLEWIGRMDIDISRVRLYNQSDNPFNPISVLSLNVAIKNKHIKVIALGQVAARYLDNVGVDEYYKLTHPSGLNRSNNDPKRLKKMLDSCSSYVYS
jgi:hypothetical protein